MPTATTKKMISPNAKPRKILGGPSALTNENSIEDEVRELNAELKILQRKTAVLVVQIGGKLHVLKSKTKHGQWEFYVEEHLGIPSRTARRYMTLWKRVQSVDGFGEVFKTASVADLTVTELENWLEEIEAGESPKRIKKTKTAPYEPLELRLSDGSTVDLKRFGWTDGVLSFERLEKWLRDSEKTASDGKLGAPLQRVVLRLAASVNNACGRADRNAACSMVDTAFTTVLKLLQDSERRV